MQKDCKPDASCEIQDTFCGSIMVVMKFKFVRGNNVDDSATTSIGTAPDRYLNHGTKLLK